jgi:hypothetical protein
MRTIAIFLRIESPKISDAPGVSHLSRHHFSRFVNDIDVGYGIVEDKSGSEALKTLAFNSTPIVDKSSQKMIYSAKKYYLLRKNSFIPE